MGGRNFVEYIEYEKEKYQEALEHEKFAKEQVKHRLELSTKDDYLEIKYNNRNQVDNKLRRG